MRVQCSVADAPKPLWRRRVFSLQQQVRNFKFAIPNTQCSMSNVDGFVKSPTQSSRGAKRRGNLTVLLAHRLLLSF